MQVDDAFKDGQSNPSLPGHKLHGEIHDGIERWGKRMTRVNISSI